MLNRRRKKLRGVLQNQFGCAPTDYEKEYVRGRLEGIQKYHGELRDIGRAGDIDDVTWNDLEMDEIFLRVNQTKSFIGEQVLYHRLHDTNSLSKEREQFEHQLLFYANNTNLRLELEENLYHMGKNSCDYYLPVLLLHPELCHIRGGRIRHFLQLALLICFTGTVTAGWPFFAAGLTVIVCVNLFVYIFAKQQYEVFLQSLGSLKKLLLFCQMAASEKYRRALMVEEDIIQITEEMRPIIKCIVGWQGRKTAAIFGDIAGLVQDYLFGITLLDLSIFQYIMKKIDRKRDKIMRLFEFAGIIDMGISIASFRASLPSYCKPQIGEKGELSVNGLVHPLIPDAVKNDFELQRRALVTGANASGKSTFMKALAINVILAQVICTCTAASFYIPKISVMTSMSLKDDILSGESYYIREAKRIREMISQSGKTLFIIDEILKGTNTDERLAASEAILQYFTRTRHFIVVATHDIELVKQLMTGYDDYYFESTVTEGNIIFEYRMKKGIGGASNAIALLVLLNYPEEIVAEAKRKVGRTNEDQ